MMLSGSIIKGIGTICILSVLYIINDIAIDLINLIYFTLYKGGFRKSNSFSDRRRPVAGGKAERLFQLAMTKYEKAIEATPDNIEIMKRYADALVTQVPFQL